MKLKQHQISVLLLLLLALASPLYALSRISVDGKYLINPRGKQVILHGVNIVNKQPPYTPQALGIDQRNVKFMAEYGVTVVRLGVLWAGVEPSPGHYNDVYLRQIRAAINLFAKYGIYTLIDFHQDAYSNKYNVGAGMPQWAALGAFAGDNPGFPLNYLGGLSMRNYRISTYVDDNFDAFWQNTPLSRTGIGIQSYYIGMLHHVAEFFKGNPNVLGYDIMNEPFPGSQWLTCNGVNQAKLYRQKGCPDFSKTQLLHFYQAASDSIHQADPQTIAWYEPESAFGAGASTSIPAIQRKNIGFSFHIYCTKNYKQCYQNVLHQQSINPVPLLMSEFGAGTLSAQEIPSFLSFADQYNISWIYWSYVNNPVYKFSKVGNSLPDDPRKQGLVYNPHKPLSGENIKTDYLNALAQPYLRMVAGRIISASHSHNKYCWTIKPTTHITGYFKKLNIMYILDKKHYSLKLTNAKLLPIRANDEYIIENLNLHNAQICVTEKTEE